MNKPVSAPSLLDASGVDPARAGLAQGEALARDLWLWAAA